MKKILILFTSILSYALPSFCQTDTLPYIQDFEGFVFPPQDWQFFGSNGNASWEHNTTIGAYGKSSGCMFFDNFTTDLSGNYYGIRAVSLDLSSATKPMLKFDVAYARKSASNSDRLGIWYSFNGTSGWMNLQNFQDATLTTAPDEASYFTPSDTQWDSITIDLSQFAGTAFIRFAFENNCDFGNVMYIDNVHFYDADQPNGIRSNVHEPMDIHVFPNPADHGLLTVRLEGMGHSTFNLYNLSGQKISMPQPEKTGRNTYLINLQPLPKGLYQLVVTDQQHVVSETIVFQ